MPLSNALLKLLRAAIGHCNKLTQKLTDEEWVSLYELVTKQCVNGIVIDGIEQLPEDLRPPKEQLLQWIGNVLQGYEYRFELYRKAIEELAGWYNAHGYKMMVIKGYACSLNWPKPEHRPCGDIDIWLFGKQKEADVLFAKEKGVKVDTSHHHHTVYDWQGFSVENHYDFVNVYAHKSSAELEKIFKELGQDDSHYVEVNGEKVYLPSPNLHTLFLIRHLVSHFAAAGITLRQVLDWAFFVEKHSKEIDWNWLLPVLERFHMKEFFACINTICILDLGFDASLFPLKTNDLELKNRILGDVLSPEFSEKQPSGFFRRMAFKYRRWCANNWKHRLCYKENLFISFWAGLWAHFIKPSSFMN